MLPEIGFGDVFDFFAKVFDPESESGRYPSDPTHAKIWQLKAYSEAEARNDKARWTAAGLTVAHHSELPLTEGDKATHAWVARDGSDQPMRQAAGAGILRYKHDDDGFARVRDEAAVEGLEQQDGHQRCDTRASRPRALGEACRSARRGAGGTR